MSMPAARTAQVRDARLHDARHTAATVLLELGITQRAAQHVMGWSARSTVAVLAEKGCRPVGSVDLAHRVRELKASSTSERSKGCQFSADTRRFRGQSAVT